MIDDLELTHKQQQEAVEEIQKLMKEGMSCAEAIVVISQKIRQSQRDDLDNE